MLLISLANRIGMELEVQLTKSWRQSGFKNQQKPVILALHTRWANCCWRRSRSAGRFTGCGSSGAEQSIRAIPARQAAAHRRGGCAEGYRCGHSTSEGLCHARESFAQYTLGKLYLLGHEVQADREEALRYFAQSAAQGNTYAQYFIDHQERLLRCGGGNRYPSDAPSDESHFPRERRPACHLCRNADRQEASPQIAGEAYGNRSQGG